MSKVKLVALIYEDNSVLYMRDSEAQDWIDKANQACTIADIHGMNPFSKSPVKKERITTSELIDNIKNINP